MKKIQYLLSSLLVLALVLSACNKNASDTPPTIPATQTIAPATKIPSTPTLQTVALDAPTIGSTISWFDTSTLVYVPEGEFIMGADEPQEQDFNPAHTIALDGFWIYSTKVTNEMYNLCISVGQCTLPASDPTEPAATLSGTSFIMSGSDPNDPIHKDFPVTNVTWDQASTYCQWAGGRLPTEAEWEKTARGTESQMYPWGEAEPSCDLLNFGGCIGYLSGVLDHPDGMSDYKALDMAGNSYEWVSDWYQADYYAQSPSANPTGPETGTTHSVRGSSFESDSNSVQSYKRISLEPEQKKIDLGFRCVVKDPTIFAPMCQMPAIIAENTINSALPASGSSGTGNTDPVTKCTPPQIPDIQYSSTCQDKGNNFSTGWLSLLHHDSLGITDFSWNCNNSLVNCIFTDVKYPVFSFYGTSGQSVIFTIKTSCTTPSPPPSKGSPVSCPIGYTLDSNGVCQFASTTTQPTTTACAGGYTYNPESMCCSMLPSQTSSMTNQFPMCGPGFVYDPTQKICYLGKYFNSKTVVSNVRTFNLYLAECPKPKEKDKPQQPPPCTIDPATGACN